MEWWGAGMGCWCLERGADLHMAQLMPLPLTVSCFSKIQIGFTFLVPAHLGSPGKRVVKWVCVCVCVCVCIYIVDGVAEVTLWVFCSFVIFCDHWLIVCWYAACACVGGHWCWCSVCLQNFTSKQLHSIHICTMQFTYNTYAFDFQQ